MIVLDTNVISEPTKLNASPRVIAWLNAQDRSTLFLTAINLAELLKGVAVLPEGKRKQAVQLATDIIIQKLIRSRILPFDREAAEAHAALVMRAKSKHYTLPYADGLIAAIAAVHGFAVATRDIAPFVAAGVAVVNPWEA